MAGIALSLEAWRGLDLARRQQLIMAGASTVVSVDAVERVLGGLGLEANRIAPRPDPQEISAELELAIGERVGDLRRSWPVLSALERYALCKLARGGKKQPGERSERFKAACDALLKPETRVLTHLTTAGSAHMVNVSEKIATARQAVARAFVRMQPGTLVALREGRTPKGDVLAVARIAGIQAAKRTPELIPLCHAIALTGVEVELTLDDASPGVAILATARAFDRTGVEMEALVAASVAALALYDMLKSVDREMTVTAVELVAKSGGRSGDFQRGGGSAFELAGSPPSVALSLRALSVESVVEAVTHGGAGAVVTFVGRVRDTNDGHAVTLLEYEAYESMAVAEMARIKGEIERELPLVRVAVHHRVGALGVGEAAVVCAASAPHRAEAYHACRLLIDRVKERVPIWKREHGPDGPYWVGWQDARCAGHDHGAAHVAESQIAKADDVDESTLLERFELGGHGG